MTPAGAALDELVLRLSNLGADDNLVGEPFASALIFELLATPFVWPLDDYLYEMLLEFSGLCLDDADSLQFGVSITCFLLGADGLELQCSHGANPSPLCKRISSIEDPDAFRAGQAALSSHTIQTARAMRKMRIKLAQTGRNPGWDDDGGAAELDAA